VQSHNVCKQKAVYSKEMVADSVRCLSVQPTHLQTNGN